MKRIAMLAVLVVGLMALPGTASARTDCEYEGGSDTVYTDGGVTGEALVGVCIDTNEAFDGGYLEVGSGDAGTYAVIDGSDSNPGQLAGYGAITDYENGGKATGCPDNESGATGTNSGGCLLLRNPLTGAEIVSVPGVPVGCGNTTGPDFANAGRDGCSIP